MFKKKKKNQQCALSKDFCVLCTAIVISFLQENFAILCSLLQTDLLEAFQVHEITDSLKEYFQNIGDPTFKPIPLSSQ